MNLRLPILLLFSLFVTILAAAEKQSAWIEVELRDGRTFSGEPVSLRDQIVSIRTIVGGGEVDRGFPAERIAALRFSDTETVKHARELIDDGQTEEALSVLEEIWLPRAPFLSLLDQKTVALLAELPHAHLTNGDLYRAVGLAQRLLPHADETKTVDRIQEVILLGYLKLKLWAEAEDRAREWIDTQPRFSNSALGWRVLAELALREERLEDLLWIALQPIAITGAGKVDHLADCYALAIHAFHLQENSEQAGDLFREMHERGLLWPEHEQLRETGTEFAKLNREIENENDSDPEADLDLRPPEKDLNLPIDHVRKSTKRPQ